MMTARAQQSYSAAGAAAAPAVVPTYSDDEIRAHLPLVRRVVRRVAIYKPPHVEMDEMVSWGLEGLLDALKRFDSAKQPSFEAYAQVRIRGAILDRLRSQGWMSRGVRVKAARLEKTYRELERQLGRPATEEEVAAALEIPLSELHTLLVDVGRGTMTAIDDMKVEPGQAQVDIEDILHADEADPVSALLSRERAHLVAEAIGRLPEKERTVVALYYREGITMREVAAVLDLTESRISQLHSQALRRLGGLLAEHFGPEEDRR